MGNIQFETFATFCCVLQWVLKCLLSFTDVCVCVCIIKRIACKCWGVGAGQLARVVGNGALYELFEVFVRRYEEISLHAITVECSLHSMEV